MRLLDCSTGDIVKLSERSDMLKAYRVQRVGQQQTALLPVSFIDGVWHVSSKDRGLSLKADSYRECWKVN